jgi:outer membrane protein TolC
LKIAAGLPMLLLVAHAAAGQSSADQPSKDRPRVVTLADAIQEGLAFDPGVRADGEAIRQAEADVVTASRPPNPTLSFSRTLGTGCRTRTMSAC